MELIQQKSKKKFTLRELHLEIEHQCLLNCKHCSSQQTRQQKLAGFSWQHVKELLLHLDGDVNIFLTGGEPLLCPELTCVMERLRETKQDCFFHLFTTGILNKDGDLSPISSYQAKKLKDLGLKSCYVSVYGHNADIHDCLTQYSGAFHKTRESVSIFKNIGVDIYFQTVITKENISQLDKIIQLAHEWRAKGVRFLKLIPQGEAKYHWDDIGISPTEYNDAIKKILENYETKTFSISISGQPSIVPCRPFQDARKCQAGSELLYMSYLGDVTPCACVKNNENSRIAHISEKDILIKYLEQNENVVRDFCLSAKNDANAK